MGRLRTNAHAVQLIKQFPNYINLENFQFPKEKIFLEIGCGKGDFLIKHASLNSDVFFLGIEKYSTVILKALQKIKKNNAKINNLAFSCLDVSQIDVKKFKNKISHIFLNFSDPWPKKRHAKRRLTSPNFLNLYKILLRKGSLIEFKTDNDLLYEYSIDILQNRQDIQILYKTNDLYSELSNPFNQNNIQTEYEQKFVKINKKIKKIIWKYNI